MPIDERMESGGLQPADLQTPWLQSIHRTKKERREENKTIDKSVKCQGSIWHNVVAQEIKTTQMTSITKTSKRWWWPMMAVRSNAYDGLWRWQSEEDSKTETVQDCNDNLWLTKQCDDDETRNKKVKCQSSARIVGHNGNKEWNVQHGTWTK